MLACDVIVTQGDVMYFSYVVGRKSLSVAWVAFVSRFMPNILKTTLKQQQQQQQQQQKDLREYNQVWDKERISLFVLNYIRIIKK